MTEPLDPARALRLSRLASALAERLTNADAALEVLVSEAAIGEAQIELWRALHAAARRDQADQALAAAYQRLIRGRRLQQIDANAQAVVLVHAADFFEATGDGAAVDAALLRVQEIVPGHKESFARLERRIELLADGRRVLELYGLAAPAEPKGSAALASKAIARLLPLPASAPLAPDACERLVVLVPQSPRLLDALVDHCKKTQRFALACVLMERALADPDLTEDVATDVQRRLVELYVGDAKDPESAIDHVEALLTLDPADAAMRRAAQRLLSIREVAGRAATALQGARRSTMPPPPVSQRPPRASD